MRPLPKRPGTRQTRSNGTLAQTSVYTPLALNPPVPVVPNVPVASHEEHGFSSPGNHEGTPCFRVGDAVLACTAGKPAREATVLELDPSDGSRFKVAFKDKRKKGGWRSAEDLSYLVPPGMGSGSSSSSASPASPASPTVPAGGAAPEPTDQGARQENVAVTPSSSFPSQVREVVEPTPEGTSSGSSHAAQPKTPVIATEAQRSTTEQIADNHAVAAAAAAAAPVELVFRIGDEVLVPAGSHLLEATIVRVDMSKDPFLVRLSFKDRRKDTWRAASGIVPADPPASRVTQTATQSVPGQLSTSNLSQTAETKARGPDVVTPSATGVGKAGVAVAAAAAIVDYSDANENIKNRRRPSAILAQDASLEQIRDGSLSSSTSYTSSSATDTPTVGAAAKTGGARASSLDARREKGDINNNSTAVAGNGTATLRAGDGKDGPKRAVDVVLQPTTGSETSTSNSGDRGSARRPTSNPIQSRQAVVEARTETLEEAGQQIRQPRPPQPRFALGDSVLLPASRGGALQVATVVQVDASAAPRFRLAFKDRRKKDAWRTTEEIIPATATAAANAVTQEVSSGTETGEYPKKGHPVEELAIQTLPTKHVPSKKRKRPTIEAAGGGASVVTAETGGEASDAEVKAGERAGTEVVLHPGPRPKRGAATAAASAISLTGAGAAAVAARQQAAQQHAKRSGVGLSDSNNNVSKNKGKAKARPSSTAVATKPPRTPRKGWKRPKVVTPGTLEGRPEPALLTSHPTEGIRPRRAFKTQQARITPKARNKANASVAPASMLSGAANSSRPAFRRPLCQPSQSLLEFERGTRVRAGGFTGEGDGNDADLRRGRRTRRQVHPSLSEDKIAAAVCGGTESDRDESIGDAGCEGGEGGAFGQVPLRFRKSANAPWGDGETPRIKVTLSLLEDGAPLSAERSAIAVVSFVADRHRYSGEQLVNVLIAVGFLCYCDEDNKVFVLAESRESDQKEQLKRVQELALLKCGVQVVVTPWLSGRPALDEFLDNHRRVIHHIVRHRLATAMWSEVDGVYFNALFCGRRSKRTFNGVRLGINLAISNVAKLETGVWELWITVEPVVHRFSPVDWWELIQEKQEKNLRDFSGSKSDDLEERLQVICLPKCTRGVVCNVQEDAFEMDRLQEANLKRGYLVGPRSEDEMVEYWRQVHHINLPSTNFAFVKVLIGAMVLTYPSWCVIRGQAEVPEATKALRGRILDAFTDALDSMEGIAVVETSLFSWHMLCGGGPSGEAPAFTTANGTVVGEHKKTTRMFHDDDATGACSNLVAAGPSLSPEGVPLDANTFISSTLEGPERDPIEPGGSESSLVRKGDIGKKGSLAAPTEKTRASPASSGLVEASSVGIGPCTDGLSPESRIAKAAAQASVTAVRQSVIRRRGGLPARVSLAATPLANAQEASGGTEGPSATRLCSTAFEIRRPLPSSGVSRPTTQGAAGVGKSARGRPLDLGESGGDRQVTHGRAPKGLSIGRAARAAPDTPQASGRKLPPAGRFMTPAAADKVGGADGSGMEGTKPSHQAVAPPKVSVEKGKKRKTMAKGDTVQGRAAGGCPQDGASGQPLGAAVPAEYAVASSAAAVVPPAEATPVAARTRLVVTFSVEGSLGLGLGEDETEEGSVVLTGKSPTSAAAGVPDGWRFTEVDGNNVQGLGADKVAALLSSRPVDITFEPVSNDGTATTSASSGNAATVPEPATRVPANPARATVPRKRAPAKPKTTKAAKSKKAAKVITARKTFKVQSRGQGGVGSAPGGSGTSAAKRSSAAVPAHPDIATI